MTVQDLLDRWNSLADETGVVKCRGLSPKRLDIIEKRWDDIIPVLDEIFDEIRHSKFLTGKTSPGPDRSKPYRLDLISLFQRDDLYLKILEQRYRDEERQQQQKLGVWQ